MSAKTKSRKYVPRKRHTIHLLVPLRHFRGSSRIRGRRSPRYMLRCHAAAKKNVCTENLRHVTCAKCLKLVRAEAAREVLLRAKRRAAVARWRMQDATRHARHVRARTQLERVWWAEFRDRMDAD